MPDGTTCFCNAEFAASTRCASDTIGLYVGHVTDKQRSRIVNDLKDRECVFIRCSSMGRSKHSHALSGKLAILELRPDFGTVRKSEWTAIMSRVRDRRIVSQILAGDVPSELQRYFGNPVLPQWLTALAILCQGYLAVYCGPAKNKDGVKVDDVVVRDSAAAVAVALRKMKWGEVLKSANCLLPALTSSDQTQREQLQKTVSKSSFWAAFDQSDSAQPINAAKKEWMLVGGAVSFARSKTKALIEVLPKKQKAAGKDFAKRVAEAYVEIAERLEKAQ
jgi:hypothetical protein